MGFPAGGAGEARAEGRWRLSNYASPGLGALAFGAVLAGKGLVVLRGAQGSARAEGGQRGG
eukprot:11179967-Lingulodinium_polyedra.AAC.1